MRRRRYRKQPVKVSLFPFLAVLICTMGTLIVLLVLVVQQARVYASAQSTQDSEQLTADQELEELQLEQEDFRWRREVLEQERSEIVLRLANSRLQLGHLEEHIRQLEREWKQLTDAATELEQRGAASLQDGEQTKAELVRLRQAIQTARDQLVRARQEAAERPQAFAIIPYDGPHSTRRRPIYIECTETGIVLQPEGIELTPADFEGPAGPGNPLDAALRTIREHLAQTGRIEQDGEPYPLLIVRPRGTVAYLVAREAIKSWDDEFGYELIDGEMKLAYPTADPVLRKQLVRAIDDARQRQAILAAAMPSRFKSALTGFVATPHQGGFVPSKGDPAPTASNNRGGGNGFSQSSSDQSRARQQAGSPDQDHWPAERSSSTSRQPNTSAPHRGGPSRDSATASGAASFSTAQSRGANWALPGAAARATGITRPIRIACLPDQLMILPQRSEQQKTQVIVMPGPLSDALDEFVTAIWKHTEQWGIAVAGGYWKPILNVEVAPGADQRFAELKSLLEGSGLEARRVLP